MSIDLNQYINLGLTHSIHTSEVRSFRGCRRRWDWISRQFFYPTVTPRPLEFGVAFHAAMEKYYESYLGLFLNPDPSASLAVALAEFRKVTKQQRDKYISLNGGIDEVMDQDYHDRVTLGEGMLKYYFTQIAEKADGGLKPLKVEIKFEVPIAGPADETMWCKCDWCKRRWRNSEVGIKDHDTWQKAQTHQWWIEERYWAQWQGLPVTFGGRLDILFEDEFGNYWIGDWKTAARIAGDEVNDEFIDMDEQITGYYAALVKLGLPVVGFIYAEIKKAVPEEPELMRQTRLGRRFSVNKNMSTTFDLYRKTVEENDPEAFGAGLYDDFLEYLEENAPVFHKRHMVTRTEAQLEGFWANLWQQAREMTDPNVAVYPNMSRFHCQGFVPGSGCAFMTPCMGKERGEDYVYTLDTMFQKLDRHYWEDAPMTTDKRMEQM